MPRKRPETSEDEECKQRDALDALLADRSGAGRRPSLMPDQQTLDTIFQLAKLFCSQEEAAAVLGVSRRTFQNFLYEYEVATDAWEDGMQFAKVSLRRKQLALADKSAPVAIFLGKNYLGQRDVQENHNLNVTAEQMSEADLMRIVEQAQTRVQIDRKHAETIEVNEY